LPAIAAPDQWRLYVITDEELAQGRSHVEVAGEALAGGADAIQLRDKRASGKTLVEIGREIRRLTRERRIPFILNDRVDVALAVEADGVHVGQDDLPARVARALIGPDRILGVSAASVEEAIQAEADGADYVGVGPVFDARATKPDALDPVGLDLLRQIRRRVGIPIIAIGGITHDRVGEVIANGADGAAIVSAIVAAPDIATAARRMKALIMRERK
jgi:thiamine-phosphate pyrophosphorylase